jgi:hypothetical protein
MPNPIAKTMGMARKTPIENTEPVVQLLSIGHIRKGMGRKPVLAAGFVFAGSGKVYQNNERKSDNHSK